MGDAGAQVAASPRCSRCRGPKPAACRTSQCDGCLVEQRDRERFVRAGTWIAYTPLEDVLAQPAVRILRTLRWFDWIEVSDLLLAAGASEEHDASDRAALLTALSRATAAGHVERFVPPRASGGDRAGRTSWYRITAAGRGELARRLAVDLEIATDEAEGDVPAVRR